MNAHELARILLGGPDFPVIVGGDDPDVDGSSWCGVVRVAEHTADDSYWFMDQGVHREPAIELRIN